MPPKNSRRPAKKFSEFRKLQIELNPSRAREIELKLLKPCEPECKPKENCHSSNCKHFDLPKDPINWTPGAPYDEEKAKRHLARVQMCDLSKQNFKRETNEHCCNCCN